MKRIEDASEEIKDIFEEVWKVITIGRSQHLGDREIAEHFFMTGISSARVFYGLMLNKKKRTIAHLAELGGHIYVISNDGKLFRNHYATPKEWQTLPDLPQD